MFAFLRYPDMPPHNNAAELEIRDTAVLHRNVRHQLSESEGREVFSVLISVARTCHKQGIFPRQAVENTIRILAGAYSGHPNNIRRFPYPQWQRSAIWRPESIQEEQWII